jgi:hypothetical protein
MGVDGFQALMMGFELNYFHNQNRVLIGLKTHGLGIFVFAPKPWPVKTPEMVNFFHSIGIRRPAVSVRPGFTLGGKPALFLPQSRGFAFLRGDDRFGGQLFRAKDQDEGT